MNATIRLATEKDAAAIAAIYAPFCDAKVTSFEFTAPTAEDMASRITTTTRQWPWLVLEYDGIVAGYAYASRHHDRAAYQWAVDTAIYVGEGARGRGVGRALYGALFERPVRLRAPVAHERQALAGVALPNPASVGLHEACGFKLVGVYRGIGYKFGAWHDVAWYELVLQPERDNPPAPRPMSEIKGVVSGANIRSAG